jgi:hypothetical protein
MKTEFWEHINAHNDELQQQLVMKEQEQIEHQELVQAGIIGLITAVIVCSLVWIANNWL